MHTDTQKLFAAVGDSPTDDSPRWVLADFLTEQGDPRGEFLWLQLHMKRQQFTAAMRRRADELFRRHAREWFREVEPFLADFRVEAGFPVEGWLARGLTVEQLQAACALPAFVTLERLHGPLELVVEALAAPSMAALSKVSVRNMRELALVAERALPGRITELTLHLPLDLLAAEQLLRDEAFRSLQSLVLAGGRGESAEALRSLSTHPTLASVEVSEGEGVLPHLQRLWPETRWKRVVVGLRAGQGETCARRCVFERALDGATTVQLEGSSRTALRRMRVLMPAGTTRVVMFPLQKDDDPVTTEQLLRQYEGLGPVVY